MLHISFHFILPLAIARGFARPDWHRAYLLMMSTMLVDLDHLLATPIYDPQRCSIAFHPLHHPLLFIVYIALCFYRPTRWIGIGLCVHMGLDAADCLS